MSALSAAKDRGGITDAIRAMLAAAQPFYEKAIWAWFDANQDRVLFSKWGFINIRVRDFRMVVEEIAGPDPTVMSLGQSA